MNFIAGMVIVATITLGLYRIIELFARRKERMAIIDKIQQLNNMELPDLGSLFGNKAKSFISLRISLLMLGLGLGLLIGFFITLNLPDIDFEYSEMIYAPCLLIFGGIALLCSYLIEQKQSNKK